jgi:hypothetical protein
MRTAEGFRYLGSFTFDLSAGARVARHLFVEGGPDVRRMIVVHLEEFLPGVDDLYRYALADPEVLGGETYGRSTNVLSLLEERTVSPDAEMAHTEEFLRRKGLTLGDRHAVARYARIVGHDRRKEILIFYHEIDGSEAGVLVRAREALRF